MSHHKSPDMISSVDSARDPFTYRWTWFWRGSGPFAALSRWSWLPKIRGPIVIHGLPNWVWDRNESRIRNSVEKRIECNTGNWIEMKLIENSAKFKMNRKLFTIYYYCVTLTRNPRVDDEEGGHLTVTQQNGTDEVNYWIVHNYSKSINQFRKQTIGNSF